MDKLENIGLEILNTTLAEWIAVIASLVYVILIARKRIEGWYFAALASGIYVYLCYISEYYLETLLQIFYLAMAVWGWISWNKSKYKEAFIIRWSFSHHALNILVSAAVTLLAGYLFDVYTDQALPYLDAFTTVFSIGATFMVARRVLENWIYWIAIDLVSIYLYSFKDLNMTAVLYLSYTIVATFGYFRWWKEYRRQKA